MLRWSYGLSFGGHLSVIPLVCIIRRRGTWSTFGGVIVYQIAGGLHHHAAGTRLIRLRVHSISFRVVIVYHSACAYGLSCCGGHTVYHSARTWLIIRRGTWSTFGGVIVYQIAGGLHHQAAGTRLIIPRGIRSIIRGHLSVIPLVCIIRRRVHG